MLRIPHPKQLKRVEREEMLPLKLTTKPNHSLTAFHVRLSREQKGEFQIRLFCLNS